ncbi:MAG: alpha/beta hydrolase, partial [Ornithinimicrobium sp.]
TPRSRVPTTYLWGRRDFALGPVAARATADLVRADYRFLEIEAGHWLPETVPVIVAEEVLRRVDAT